MSVVTEDMIIDAVDLHDVPIGPVPRRDVFARKANFRVAHIFLFNKENELLLQQLAPTRDRHPGYWGSSVAAYLYAGEPYDVAAQRRLREELGTSADLHYFGTTSMNDEGCVKFIGLFVATCEGPFQYDHAHIQKLEYLPIDTIWRMQADNDRRFTPTFLRTLKFYQPRP